MAGRKVAHPGVAERRAHGRDTRTRTPPDAHDGWVPAADRPDPVALLEEQNATREPDLVPVRHGRMMASPFTFYRGAAKIMAADLKDTPTAGLDVQLCGDAHLSNFGAFASPERTLVFDLNDFDETLPGPFEYDVKRMAASFTICARNNGFSTPRRAARRWRPRRRIERRWPGSPRCARWTSGMPTWIRRAAREHRARRPGREEGGEAGDGSGRDRPAARRTLVTACRRFRSSREFVDGQYRIVSQPPIVVPLRDLAGTYGLSADELEAAIHEQLRAYRAHCRTIGASCWSGSSSSTWRARSSASAASAPARSSSCCEAATNRIRCSCRSRKPPHRCWRTTSPKSTLPPATASASCKDNGLMQAASDIFLGWTKGRGCRTATCTGGSCAT